MEVDIHGKQLGNLYFVFAKKISVPFFEFLPLSVQGKDPINACKLCVHIQCLYLLSHLAV